MSVCLLPARRVDAERAAAEKRRSGATMIFGMSPLRSLAAQRRPLSNVSTIDHDQQRLMHADVPPACRVTSDCHKPPLPFGNNMYSIFHVDSGGSDNGEKA